MNVFQMIRELETRALALEGEAARLRAAAASLKGEGLPDSGDSGSVWGTTRPHLIAALQTCGPARPDDLVTAMKAGGWRSKSVTPSQQVRNLLVLLSKENVVVRPSRGMWALADGGAS